MPSLPPSPWLPLSPLGSGSSATVSLALNLANGSLFAAKSSPLLPPLLHELHFLQSLHSPFIIRCLDADLSPHSPSPCLFLEYMDGGSLANVLRRSAGSKLSNEKLVGYYTHAILQGLDYLHENGVVHCDIKSHNILVGQSGVKIADFGAARRTGVAMDGMPRGTPLWMAPEVLRGEEQGTPSDIWSLGCTVVEMLQGRPPWAHLTSLEAVMLKVGSSNENPPLPDSISADAMDFLLKCLCRDPKQRATAAQLLKHPFLCSFQEGEADASKSNQPSPRSTLDVFYESESDCESMLLSEPILHFPLCTAAQPPSPEAETNNSEAREWITVRRAERCRVINQSPFMQAEEGLQVKRACEVSFDSIAFLPKRRKLVG